MKPSNVCLPASEIPLLLSGDLPLDEVAAAESHIAECETCRNAIESMIADSRWWDDARQSLVACAARPAETDSTDDTEATSNERLLELLGPTDDPAMLGRIGVYEIVGILGRGGMGVVFKGYDGALNRFVAIKMLMPHLAASGAARKRFAREAQAAAAVVDDHVMAIHGVSEWMSVPYFVMPYARGVSLQKRLSQNGPLELREILRIAMQAAKGLAAAHAQGLVHRDVKPANIFLDEGVERVRLMDFGLARAVDDASLTRSGTLAGTPQFMSPEQARAETVDHSSDLFSLGSVMYSMCTGHAPFRAESSYSVLRLITDKEPRSICEINPDIPVWLCSIVSKLMSKQTADRYASAEDVAVLLEQCLAHVQQPTTVALPSSLATLAPKRSSRPPIGKYIAAAAFAAAMFFAGVLIVLETNKGTLQIECEADNVPIRIMKGTDTVERLTINKTGVKTRLQAGEYTIEIDEANHQFEIVGNQVTLTRGQEKLAKITYSPTESNAANALGDGYRNPSEMQAPSVTQSNAQHSDQNFEASLRDLENLRTNRKPRVDEVNDRVNKLLAIYPTLAGRIHWQATHLYGQSGIQIFADQVIEHATQAITLEADPVHRAYLFMYLSNACEAKGMFSDATDWFLKGWLELQPYNLPDVAPELPAVGKFRGLISDLGDGEDRAEKYALYMRMVETEQKQRKDAEAIRELVHFRSIYMDGLRRLTPGIQSREKLRARAKELFGRDVDFAPVDNSKNETDRIKQQKDADQKLREMQEVLAAQQVKYAELTKRNEALAHKLEQIVGEDFQYVQGRITEVADGGKTVWINLGKEDGLRPGVTFGVLDGDLTRVADAKPKARIEVVSIEAELPHRARCKVLADRAPTTILPGDAIFSPAWQPASKAQFYLLGKMDWDGDGKDDKEMIKALIRENGGEVAELSANTRFMVVGDELKVSGELDDATKKILKARLDIEIKAKSMGVTRMGHQNLKSWLMGSGGADAADELMKALKSNGDASSNSKVAPAGIQVILPLDSQRHSREMLKKNIGFDRLSLMASGIKGTIDGKPSENLTAVLAHDCRLESFEESAKDYFDATFLVPQGPTNDSSNRGLSQKRIDEMIEQGVQFWLDHDRDQMSSKPNVTPDQSESRSEKKGGSTQDNARANPACTGPGTFQETLVIDRALARS